jgi:hypothetical protein
MAQATLAYYRLQTRRLLHDANGQFYSDSDLNDYINQARLRVCADTGCNRSFPIFSFTLTAGTEAYAFSLLPAPATGQVIDIWNINVIFGNTRYRMRRRSFTYLNAMLRPWVGYQAMPTHFAIVGEQGWYMAPNPDQNYATEVDVVQYPGDLLSDGATETIPLVFQECVQYWASRQAKFGSQDWAEAANFKKQYIDSLIFVRASRSHFTIPDAYQLGVGEN